MIHTDSVTIPDDVIWINRACPLECPGIKLKWVSVKDRLPEIPQPAGQVEEYLVVVSGNKVTVSCFTWKGTWYRHDITHWMPLPEPPQ